MLRYTLIAVFALFSAGFVARPVVAEIEVQTCGIPQDGRAQTDPGGVYCDIHGRRVAYIQENVKFRQDLEERRKNFGAPQQQALRQYQDSLKALNGSHEPGQPEPQSSPKNEPAGPPAPAGSGLNP